MTDGGASTEAPGAEGPTPAEVLAEGLGAHFGRAVRIVSMEGKALETSSHPIERLRLTLDTGERLQIIFKRLRPGEKLYGNEREVLIYQRLLRGRRFGAPELYASAFDEPRGRYWLFLEDLGRMTLDHGDVDAWEAAARGLAAMHAALVGREEHLRSLGCLEEHGPDYYRAIARTAREYLDLAGARAALPRFDALMGRYDSLVQDLTVLPRTLVHGDIFPGNLVLQAGPSIRPIDWESAAIGLGAWDLARLLDGWGRDKPGFIRIYLDELARRAGASPDPRAFGRAFARCQVLNVLWHLRWSVDACRDPAFVDGRLDKLERLYRALDREGTDG